MKRVIGIEASSILNNRTGIGNYNYNLLQNILALDRKNQYVIFTNSFKHKFNETLFKNAPNVNHVHSIIPGKLLLKLWQHLRFPPIESFTGNIDLFHSTNNNPIPQKIGTKLITIYDLYFMLHPEQTAPYGGQLFYSLLPKFIHDWDHIITISEAMKREINSIFSVPDEKISVIPCGLNPFFLENDLLDENENINLPENFILSVGTLEPRKNYITLIKAFKILEKMGIKDLHLVIAGMNGFKSNEIIQTIQKENLNDKIILTGYLTDKQLRQCYYKAKLFVMTSEYEGFGIPVLEAMATKTPVVASNCTSFPEIVGDAGLLVEPKNTEEISTAIATLLENPELKKSLISKGLKKVSEYTWKKSALKTLNIYEKLLTS